jgi:hypothetical protein
MAPSDITISVDGCFPHDQADDRSNRENDGRSMASQGVKNQHDERGASGHECAFDVKNLFSSERRAGRGGRIRRSSGSQ